MSFASAVVKLTAKCDLNCSYCYMFNQGDKTYSRVPGQMSLETSLLLLRRVQEHLEQTNRRVFSLSLHGGEPTLWPIASFRSFLGAVQEMRREGFDIRVALQTNAFHLRDDMVDVLAEHGVKIGISLDGPPAFNDRYRVTHSGSGSYAAVMASVDRLLARDLKGIISGFLCVANPDIPPADLIDWGNGLPVRKLDVLWPMEFNYDNPPWATAGHDAYRIRPRYGDWFVEVFREWWRRDDPSLFIRLFFGVIQVLLGSTRHTDAVVNDTINMVVVNTDGAIEYHDYFRPNGDGATRTPFNLRDHSLSDVAGDEVFDYCLNLGRHVPTECSDCSVLGLCGGGFLPGRTKRGDNLPRRRSVLCYDQFRFFSHVAAITEPYRKAQLDRVKSAANTPQSGRKVIRTSDLQWPPLLNVQSAGIDVHTVAAALANSGPG